MTEMLKRLVVESKIVSYQYFMDEMQLYEIDLLDELVPYSERRSYEQMRLLMWSTFKSTCKNVPKPEKLLPLSTDEVDTDEDNIILNQKQQEMVSEHIKNMFLKNGKQS